ncbi:MAG: hypothetical protein AAF597_09420 [Bacteroidota bacterium]
MRWYLLTLLLASAYYSAIFAQGVDAQPTQGWHDTMMVRITQRLQLTPDQVPQVRTLLEAHHADMQNNPPASVDERKVRKRALRSRVMAILTPAQRERLKAQRGGSRNQKNAAAGKRHWLDVIIEDVAAPLLDRRKRNGG